MYYICRFNGFKFEAKQAIDAIATRASYQGLNEVILLTNAIKNCNYLLNTGEKTKPLNKLSKTYCMLQARYKLVNV